MNFLRNILIIIIIILAILAFMYFNGLKPVDVNNTEPILFEVVENSNYREIGNNLEEEDLIKSKLVFDAYLRKENSTDLLKAGRYSLSKSMSLEEIVDILIEGKSSSLTFTIPEGFEMKQVIDLLVDSNYGDRENFSKLMENKSEFEGDFEFLKYIDEGQNLEGYLYPATYEVLPGESERNIIYKMLEAFEYVYETENLQELAKEKNLNLNELITISSIIEREAVKDEERPIMAQVFYSRLKEGIPLGSCATVQYIIDERKPVLSIADTKIESPYNTYKNQGLPPYPIASPGLLSIEAALNPADTHYLYFVRTGEDGSHTFSRTYEEHLEAEKDMIVE